MKRNKAIIIAMFMVLAGSAAMAQEQGEFNTHQRISDQLKNGTAPGLKFGPASKKVEENVSQPTAAERAGTIGRQLRNGGLQGANIAKGGGGAMNRTSINSKRAAVANQPLASDAKAGTPLPVNNPAGTNISTPAQGNVPQPELKVIVPKTVKKAAEAPAPAQPQGASPRSAKPD